MCAEAVQSDRSRCEVVKGSAGTVRNSLPFGLSAPQGWRHSVRSRSLGGTHSQGCRGSSSHRTPLVQVGVKADQAHHLLRAQLPQRRVSSTVGSPTLIRSPESAVRDSFPTIPGKVLDFGRAIGYDGAARLEEVRWRMSARGREGWAGSSELRQLRCCFLFCSWGSPGSGPTCGCRRSRCGRGEGGAR